MQFFHQQRAALVTGGDSGIGLATAKSLASEGVRILLTDQTEAELKTAAEDVRAHAESPESVVSFTADIRKNSEVLQLLKFGCEKFGHIDIVAHCAGVRGAAGDFLELTDEDWLESIDVDLMGAVRICRAFLPDMLDRGWGRIVLIASENALVPYEEESPYNACKAGIINLTKCLSRAYSPKGAFINCVSPAFIATPMTDGMMDEKVEKENLTKEEAIKEFLAENRPNIVVDRRGRPEEVAAVITFLCSELVSYVTGSNYRVDGGSVGSAFG